MSEAIWDRIGFALIGAISGFLYALTVSLFAITFSLQIDYLQLFIVFTGVFALAGLFCGNLIITSAEGCIYSVYLVYGYVLGFISSGGFAGDNDILSSKTSGKFFVILGALAAVICITINYL